MTHILKVLSLFAESDMLTFVVPDTLFGILGALSGPLLTTNSTPNALMILTRTPHVVLFVWINLLVFDIANQRLPKSIIEDSVNKPQRPLPRRLITPVQTRRLLLTIVPLILGASYYMTVWQETSLLFILTWMYNDLEGGDENCIVRNEIIAAAFGLYHEGALRLACGPEHVLNCRGFSWTAVISGVIFSTMHVQDMKDQAGDLAKGRRSVPIVFGDRFARWTIAVPVAFWSLFCPLYWGVGIIGWLLSVGVGFVVAIRELMCRSRDADRLTWVIWAGWLSALYLLPLTANP